jgi:hypothetical protein
MPTEPGKFCRAPPPVDETAVRAAAAPRAAAAGMGWSDNFGIRSVYAFTRITSIFFYYDEHDKFVIVPSIAAPAGRGTDGFRRARPARRMTKI